MKQIKKKSLFSRAEFEMTDEEYKAYVFGTFFGRMEGFVFGVILTTIIAALILVVLK